MKNIYKILILLAVSLLVFKACSEENPTKPKTENINFSGIVQDEYNHLVPFADVILKDIDEKGELNKIIVQTQSDDDAYFIIENVEVSSNAKIFIEKTGFKIYSKLLSEFLENSIESQILKLEEDENCCGKIALNIKDEDGNSISEVEVKLRTKNEVLRKTKSNNEGSINFEGLCLGEFELRLYKEGYDVIEKLIEINECEETQEIDFILKVKSNDKCCDQIVDISPLDKDGNIINGAKVKLYKDSKVIEEGTVKDGNKVIFDNVCEGKHTIFIQADGFTSIEYHIDVACNQNISSEKTLTKKEDEKDCCDQIVDISPLDKDGNIINGAKVKLYKDGKVIEEGTVKDGNKVIFDNVCEGKHTIFIQADGFTSIEYHIDVACNQNISSEKTLTKKDDDEKCCDASLKLIIKDKDTKEIITNANITLTNIDTGFQHKKISNNDGEVIFEKLCKLTYDILIEIDGYEIVDDNFKIEKCKEYQEHYWMKKN